MPDDEPTSPAPPGTTVHHIAPKLPTFWPEDPELFFVRVEAEFDKARPKITSEQTKFSYLVGTLDKDHATLVRNQLVTPDPNTPFTALKNELVRQFTLADHTRIQRAQVESLADKKPSALLCRLQQLLPATKFKDTYIRDLFLSKMPENLQAVLASMTQKNLQDLAQTADEIIDFQPQSIAATPQVHSEINALREEVYALRGDLQRQRQGKSEGPGMQRYCWYHSRFGRKATKCAAPCQWKGN